MNSEFHFDFDRIDIGRDEGGAYVALIKFRGVLMATIPIPVDKMTSPNTYFTLPAMEGKIPLVMSKA